MNVGDQPLTSPTTAVIFELGGEEENSRGGEGGTEFSTFS